MQKFLNQLIYQPELLKEFSSADSKRVMAQLISGLSRPEQIGAFLGILAVRGPTGAMLAGFAEAFRERAIQVPLMNEKFPNLIDVCGTGGDGLGTFNISTTVAFVAAACGLPIAKHGNRSVSSRSGSFDVLEALGVPFADNSEEAQMSLLQHRMAFMYAPSFHPVFRELANMRRALGFRTVLNALGPLLNPAGVRRQLVGVYSRELVVPMAEALGNLGAVEAMVVAGDDGADEISLCAETHVAHLKDGQVRVSKIKPEDFDLKRVDPETLLGGDAAVNAKILFEILNGEHGPRRDVVVLNTAAALLVGGVVSSIREGVQMAQSRLDDGSAAQTLERLRQITNVGAAL